MGEGAGGTGLQEAGWAGARPHCNSLPASCPATWACPSICHRSADPSGAPHHLRTKPSSSAFHPLLCSPGSSPTNSRSATSCSPKTLYRASFRLAFGHADPLPLNILLFSSNSSPFLVTEPPPLVTPIRGFWPRWLVIWIAFLRACPGSQVVMGDPRLHPPFTSSPGQSRYPRSDPSPLKDPQVHCGT